MSKQVFEKIKRLFENFFQTDRPSKNEKESWTLWSVGETVLRTLKLLSNVFFVFVFLGCLFGGGIALGYGARIFDKVETPKKEELIKKIQDISTISELKYADGSSISAIDSDLLRVPIKSKDISDNVKNLITVGRCISANFEAQAAIRVSPIAGAIGHGGGVAAGICAVNNINVQDIDIEELRKELKKQGAFI